MQSGPGLCYRTLAREGGWEGGERMAGEGGEAGRRGGGGEQPKIKEDKKLEMAKTRRASRVESSP